MWGYIGFVENVVDNPGAYEHAIWHNLISIVLLRLSVANATRVVTCTRKLRPFGRGHLVVRTMWMWPSMGCMRSWPSLVLLALSTMVWSMLNSLISFGIWLMFLTLLWFGSAGYWWYFELHGFIISVMHGSWMGLWPRLVAISVVVMVSLCWMLVILWVAQVWWG